MDVSGKTISRKERIRRKVISEMCLDYDSLSLEAIELFFAYTDRGEGKEVGDSSYIAFRKLMSRLGPNEAMLPTGDPRHKDYTKAQIDLSDLMNAHAFREVR